MRKLVKCFLVLLVLMLTHDQAIADSVGASADESLKDANVLISQHRYREALSPLTESLKSNLKNAKAYSLRAYSYNELTEYVKALEDYSQAISIEPKRAELYAHRAETYCLMKQYDNAINDCAKAIEIDPKCQEAFGNRGMIYVELKKFPDAIRDCNASLSLNPDYPRGYNCRGNAYRGLGQLEKSISDYSQAITLAEKQGFAPKNLAELYNNRFLALMELAQQDWGRAYQGFHKSQ